MSDLLQRLFGIESDFAARPDRQKRGLRMLLDGCGRHRAAFVADSDAQVVGMATVQLVVSTAEGGLSAWVEDVVVDAAWQRRGIGSRLLAAVSDWARRVGAVRLQLLADRDNAAAVSFYRSNNWQSTRMRCLRKHLTP